MKTDQLPIRFEIPLNPITKKNSQNIYINKRTGRPFISPSSQYKKYEKDAKSYMPNIVEPIDYAVNVRCTFYMKTRRRVDLVNLLEAVDDILVKYNVLADDNHTIVAGHDGSRVAYDKESPRTEIVIERIETE